MDTNDIMVNGEVMETTEEIAAVSSGNGFKVATGGGLAVLGGIIAYKYMVKPMAIKIKARKEQQRIDKESESFDVAEVVEINGEFEETK